jgi:hypothetical protein
VFVTAFTAIGATRSGYDWQRYPVSSLAIGRRGWLQRANFILAGVLYSCAAPALLAASAGSLSEAWVPVLFPRWSGGRHWPDRLRRFRQ